jgi:hypothetical protein
LTGSAGRTGSADRELWVAGVPLLGVTLSGPHIAPNLLEEPINESILSRSLVLELARSPMAQTHKQCALFVRVLKHLQFASELSSQIAFGE